MSLTVTAGNNVIVAVGQTGADGTADYAVSDATNGAYTEAIVARSEGNNREFNFFYFLGSAGGALTITAAQTNSTTTFSCIAIEVSTAGGTTLAFDVGDALTDGASTSDHPASAGVTTSAKAICISGGVLSSTSTTMTPGTDYSTVEQLSSNLGYLQQKASLGGWVGETGTWHSTTARIGTNSIACFKEVTASSGPPPGSLMLLGVGR